MSGLILVAGAISIGFWLFRQLIMDDKPKAETPTKKNRMDNVEEQPEIRTRELLLETLVEIGCQPEVNEEDDISVKFQGENFVIRAGNDSKMITIWDVDWAELDLNIEDNISVEKLKFAINDSNQKTLITTVYTIDQTTNRFKVHCNYCMLFIPQIPHLDEYFSMVLGEFFNAHKNVTIKYRELMNQPKIESADHGFSIFHN